MSDADILIHKEDYDKVKDILLKIGYQQSQSSVIHTAFLKENNLQIELHWSLINDAYVKHSEKIKDSIWINSIDSYYYGIPIRILSNEDMLLHLCMHMAAHFVCAGFGLRQLCDFVLFVDKNRYSINWNIFSITIADIGIDKFVCELFNVCRQLFNLEIPNEIMLYNSMNNRIIDQFINEIFKSGVYGGKNLDQVVKSTAMQYHRKGSEKKKLSRIGFLLALFFPNPKIYKDKYNYARKFPYLIPFFWIHHFINGILKKNLKLSDKFISVFNVPGEAKKKQDLLEKLGLL
jgi:hypothetical protein